MTVHLDPLLRYIHSLAPLPESVADSELLERFAHNRDQGAFAELVRRHGPLVLGVCRRVLDGAAEAEDAFQAVFLVLARKAAALRRPEGLAAWLHGVARHLALKCRRAKARRCRHETANPTVVLPKDPLEELTARELLTVLDEEIQRLPEVYRLPLILCGLEGLTHAQAARRLGWTSGSVKGRLLRGRQRLQERLARRGLILPAGLLVLTAAATVPSALASATVDAAMRCAAGDISAGLLTKAASLIKPRIGLGVLLATVIAAGAGTLALQAPPAEQSSAQSPAKPDEVRAEQKKEARVDRYGDPLPPGARMRLGTVRFRTGGLIYACACSPDGKTIAVACANRTVYLFDAATGKPIRRLLGHSSDVTSLAYSPDGKILASGDANNSIIIWDLKSGKSLRQFPAIQSQGPVWSLAFSRDGKGLLAGGGQSFFCLHDLVTGIASGKERLNIPAPKGQLAHLDSLEFSDILGFSPDGRLLACGGWDRHVYLWDAHSGKQVRRWEGHHGDIDALAFAPDGRRLASGSLDTTILIWDVPQLTKEELRSIRLTQKELEAAWSALASADASEAYRNLRTLQSVPEQTVPFLSERVRPKPPPDAARLKRLFAQLDSEEYAQRERASEELRKLGWAAEPALRKALADKPSLEARKRIQALLDRMGEQGLPLELVQLLRSIEVLERVNTPAARRLLRKLADSTRDEGLGQKEMSREAKASLERLAK